MHELATLAIVFVGIAAALPANLSDTQCLHRGKTYKVGEDFQDECNSCYCGRTGRNGTGPAIARCTIMACLKPTAVPPPPCVVGSRTYQPMEHFVNSQGQQCTCYKAEFITCDGQRWTGEQDDDDAVESHQAGDYSHGGSQEDYSNEIEVMEEELEHLNAAGVLDGNQIIPECVNQPVGTVYQDACNTCVCASESLAACTLMACLDEPEEDSIERPVDQECVGHGIGYLFKRDCNFCHCYSETLAGCTKMKCVEPDSLASEESPEGTISHEIGRIRVHRGGEYPYDPIRKLIPECVDMPFGTKYQMQYPFECNTCTCTSDTDSACTMRMCPHKPDPKEGDTSIHGGRRRPLVEGNQDLVHRDHVLPYDPKRTVYPTGKPSPHILDGHKICKDAEENDVVDDFRHCRMCTCVKTPASEELIAACPYRTCPGTRPRLAVYPDSMKRIHNPRPSGFPDNSPFNRHPYGAKLRRSRGGI